MWNLHGVGISAGSFVRGEGAGIEVISFLVLMGALVWPTWGYADDTGVPRERTDAQTITDAQTVIEISSITRWLSVRFSAAELQQFRAGDLKIERHYCGCYDEPIKHYPYSVVLVRTPRGDLVARPDNLDVAVTFTLLATRQGDQYCEVDSSSCYGVFREVCDFTDFRYGPYLAQFFPTCKTSGTEPTLTVDESGSPTE